MHDRIHLLGSLVNLAQWYEAADAFALTSEFERYSTAPLEAMSYVVACMSFDIKAGPWLIIKDRVNGLLLEDDNHLPALKLGLLNLAQDEDLRKKLGTAAIDVRMSHGPHKFFSKWRNLVHQTAMRSS